MSIKKGNGCKLHDDCETCPFLDCKLGEPNDNVLGIRKKMQERQGKVAELTKQGLGYKSIALELGVPKNTVMSDLTKLKKAGVV